MKKILKIYLIVFALFNLFFFTVIKSQPDVHGILMRITHSNKPSEHVVLDKQGNLHEQKRDNSLAMKKTAEAIISMKAGMSSDVKFIVAPTLSKNLPNTEFKAPNYDTNISSDEFINMLSSYQMAILDYRTCLSEEAEVNDLFYKSDSMATVETNFWMFQEFVKFYEERFQIDLDSEDYMTTKSNYLIQTYPSSFLGAYTKDVGQYYVGADDYSIIYPNFETRYQIINSKEQIDGDFASTLLDLEKLQDPYNMTESYLTSIKKPSVIVNQSSPNEERIYVISDAKSLTFVAFLTTVFKEVHLIDINNIPSNAIDYIKTNKINNVLFAISNQEAYFDKIVK